MIYHRNGDIETEIIKAKNDIDAYDQAYLQINAMKKTVEIFKSSGIKSYLMMFLLHLV